MPTFTYEVKEEDGEVQRGTTQGETAEAVARELRAQGYLVVTVEPVAAPTGGVAVGVERQVLAPVFYPVSSKSRALFFSSLRVLMSAGMGVSEAMRTLSHRTRNRILSQAAAEMAEEAVQGRPMSTVMRKYPAAFPQVALAVLEAGEESGLIEQTAERLAAYFDRTFQLEQTYRWHTFYPKLLLIALILIPTVPVLVLGSFGAWVSILLSRSLPILVAATVLWYGWRFVARVPGLKRALDGIKLAIPWFGSLSRRLSAARWARALSMLLSAGVPVHRSLVTAASACGNAAMEEALAREAEGVLHGKALGDVLAASGQIPGMAIDMISTAERSGSIEGALDKIADYYESETDIGGKQTAMAVGLLFYLLVALAIAIVVIGFWSGYFNQYTSLLGP
jgi:type II secretory pathway component PulF